MEKLQQDRSWKCSSGQNKVNGKLVEKAVHGRNGNSNETSSPFAKRTNVYVYVRV